MQTAPTTASSIAHHSIRLRLVFVRIADSFSYTLELEAEIEQQRALGESFLPIQNSHSNISSRLMVEQFNSQSAGHGLTKTLNLLSFKRASITIALHHIVFVYIRIFSGVWVPNNRQRMA